MEEILIERHLVGGWVLAFPKAGSDSVRGYKLYRAIELETRQHSIKIASGPALDFKPADIFIVSNFIR